MDRSVKVVFDTQIFLRTVINPFSASGRLITDWDHHYVLHVSEGIIKEILEVLTRSKIRKKFPQITEERIAFVKERLNKAVFIEIKSEDIQPICRDPKDDVFLACVRLAKADFLVSEDKDLLVLQNYEKTKIITVAEFLTILEAIE